MMIKFSIKEITLFEGSLNIVTLQAEQPLDDEVVKCGDHAQITVSIGERRYASVFSVADVENSLIQLIIRSTKKGRVSDYLTDKSSLEKSVDIEFFDKRKEILGGGKTILLGAGSGIAGALGYLNSFQIDAMQIPDLLFVGNNSERPFVQAVTEKLMKMRHSPKFIWHNTTTMGRPDSEYFYNLIKDSKAEHIYSCGPEGFNDLVNKAADAAGICKTSRILDGFILDEQKKFPNSLSPIEQARVSVDIFGTKKELTWDGQKNLLDTLLGEKIQVPYSCRAGICSACQCKVISGLTKMEIDMGLNEEEKENGLSLACQLHPLSPEIEVVFE